MNTMQENMKFGKERLEQQIRFITEVDKVKNIFRQKRRRPPLQKREFLLLLSSRQIL